MWPQAGQVIAAVMSAMLPLPSNVNTFAELRFKIGRRFALEAAADRACRAGELVKLSLERSAVTTHGEV